MNRESSLEAIVIEPKVSADSCVIWLHGLGDSGAGFAPVVPMLGLPENHTIRFIFPHAPEQAVTINGGYIMRSWYDIKSMELDERASMPDVLVSEKAILALIQAQIDQGIPSHKIVLIGFSQGGVMSLFSGLRCKQKLAGVAGLSCYLANEDIMVESLSLANKATPVLINHGEQDDVVPCSAGKSAYSVLKNQGYRAEWKAFPIAHSINEEQVMQLGTWINRVLS